MIHAIENPLPTSVSPPPPDQSANTTFLAVQFKKGLANPRLREYLLPHESHDITEFLYVAILAQQGLEAPLRPR